MDVLTRPDLKKPLVSPAWCTLKWKWTGRSLWTLFLWELWALCQGAVMEEDFWWSLHWHLLQGSGPNRGIRTPDLRIVHFHLKYFLKSERLRNWALHLHISVPTQHNICFTCLETLWCCFHFLPTTTTLFLPDFRFCELFQCRKRRNRRALLYLGKESV